MTVHSIAFESVCWFQYSWNTGVIHPLDEYRATVHDRSKSTKRFLPAGTVTVISLASFIRVEDARHELRVYPGQNILKTLPGTPSMVATENLNDVYDGNLENDDCAVADLESIPGGAVAARAWRSVSLFVVFSNLTGKLVWRSHKIC